MIPLVRPDLGFAEVADDIERIIASGILTNGECVQEFESAFAGCVGAAHAVATTSATSAMHLALVAHGIGLGDEVLVSDFTFPATGNVVVSVGAIPVLVDTTADSFCLDLERARSLATPRTKALIAVHPFGQPVDPDRLRGLVEDTGIVCIEDAACALGSSVGERHCGSAFTGCFSFHPRKVVTTGEGGMLTTDDVAVAERVRRLRNHGGIRTGPAMTFVENGFNYRMAEVPAAMGLAQLRRLDEILGHRRSVAGMYESRLAQLRHVELVREPPGQTWSFQSFVIMLHAAIDRNAVIQAMATRGMETTIGTYALHAQPAFSRFGYAPNKLKHSFAAQERSLTLPLPPGMTEGDVDRVVGALEESIAEAAR